MQNTHLCPIRSRQTNKSSTKRCASRLKLIGHMTQRGGNMGVTESVIGWEQQGEALCAGWGLQTGGRSGGVKSDFFLGIWAFGFHCSFWHVISPTLVTRGLGAGGVAEAKVNHPALWKHMQKFTSWDSGHRGLWQRLTEDFHHFTSESEWIQKQCEGSTCTPPMSQITAAAPH